MHGTDRVISFDVNEDGKFCVGSMVIEVAQRKHVKYEARCADIRYSFLPFSFSSFGELEKDAFGVGASGGCEAIRHAVNRLIKDPGDEVSLSMLLVDFKNAFNLVYHEVMLQEVYTRCPAISHWVEFCYLTLTKLYYREHTLRSYQGVQQGDPFGPLLFSLVLHPLVSKIRDSFNLSFQAWYLDDGTIIRYTLIVGELIKEDPRSRFVGVFPSHISRPLHGVKLLGGFASANFNFSSELVMKRVTKSIVLMDTIAKLNDPECELLLLQRIITAFGPRFGDWQWRLSTLPFAFGGLGVYSTSDVLKYAFLAFRLQFVDLQSKLLRDSNIVTSEPAFDNALIGTKEVSQFARQAPPSPDYVPGHEHPPSLDYVLGPEHPPSPDYVPGPEYLKYLVPFDDEAPIEDQPLPTDALPTALSSGYVVDSNSEEDLEALRRGGGASSSGRLHCITVDPVSLPEDIEAFEIDESATTPPRSHRLLRAGIFIRLLPPMAASIEAHIVEYVAAPTPPSPPPSSLTLLSSLIPHIPSPPLPLPSPPIHTSPTYVEAPLGYRATMIRSRAASPSIHYPSEIPSPPLLLPSTTHRDDLLKADMPLRKRARFTAPTSRFEVRESSSAAAASKAMTAVGEVSLLTRERRYFRSMASSYEREAADARRAWAHSESRSQRQDLRMDQLMLVVAVSIIPFVRKMPPKRTTATTTAPMTNAAIKLLIAQGVSDALEKIYHTPPRQKHKA
ncbi:putative reverse transcriptase domain-containing protein [Tanacetum coccineum]